MSKFCKKCGREIPQSSLTDICEHCQNKKNGKIRKAIEWIGGAALTFGSICLFVITKGKSGGPRE